MKSLIFLSLQVFFQKDLKQQRLLQFSKRVPNLNAQIIDHFRNYLISTKALKTYAQKSNAISVLLQLLYQKQFGFQKMFSTVNAIINLLKILESQ